MKIPALLLSAALLASVPLGGAPGFSTAAAAVDAKVQDAINKGLDFLTKKQNAEGFWTDAKYPGLTALVVQAYILAPGGAHTKDAAVTKGLDFIRQQAKPNGSIYAGRMSIYNTSICLAALVRNADAKDRLLMDKAQQFLVGGQTKNAGNKASDGGYGYEASTDGKPARTDLDNTVFTLEALKLYRDMQKKEDQPAGQQLNWNAAIDFVSRCQQLPATNKESWVSTDAAEKGGFVYQPAPESGDNSGPPKSYGTMTYAGLLSFIYADVKPDDQRVKAAKEWIERRYTLEENPGRGADALYYYYHMMAKGLTAAGMKTLKTKDGKTVDWKAELAAKLISLQKPDGSWANENGRYMEKDPNLVTTYCLLALAYLAEEK